MCTATVGMGLQAFGGLYSTMQASNQQKAMASYYDYQAAETEKQAQYATTAINRQGGIDASKIEAKGREVQGTQRAGMAANGLSSDSYTYQNVLDDTEARSNLDQQAVLYNADVNSWNIRNEANQQIAGLQSAAKNARSAAKSTMLTGLLSTASQFGSTWNQWNQTSAGSGGGNSSITAKSSAPFNTNFYTGVDSIDWGKRWTIGRT